MKCICARALLVIGLANLAVAEPVPPAPEKPNVIIILADDLGYGDVQCNNPERGKIPTPHLDRLAAEGMRFTDGHSSSGVCSPSRYTLLTGRYHWRTRLQSGIVGLWGEPLIAADRLTLASLAKQHGYRTAAVGKWHLGWDWPIPTGQESLFRNFSKTDQQITEEHLRAWQDVFSKQIPEGPTTRGFDAYFGTDVPNWPPFCFVENDRTVGIPVELLPSEKLLATNQASMPGPAVKDWRLESILPALTDRACTFIADSAPRPDPFLLYLPLTTPHTPLAVNAEWKGRSGLRNDCADLIMETDAAVGRVLEALGRTGEADRTLVVFTSDNGFARYAGAAQLEEQGHFPSGALRGYKADAFEGGHRVPFIVRWPSVVQPGSVNGQLVHHADLLATFAEILDTKLPDNAGEDSFSLLPLLQGNDHAVRAHAISCASSGVPALRSGAWKLIAAPETPSDKFLQLYNLADDLGEKNNVAAEQPERVAHMTAQLERLIQAGRSTPGVEQKNDVEVTRYPRPPAPANAGTKAKAATAPARTASRNTRRKAQPAAGQAAKKQAGSQQPAADSIPTGKVYVYKHSGGKPREMEIWFPPNHDPATAKVPGLILFHGGGWSGGTRTQFATACEYFASRGMVTATVTYRMLNQAEAKALPPGETRKRACIVDARSAIRWFRQHAAELGMDPRRLVAGGGSAGGHIAVLATTNNSLNDPADPVNVDTSVAAYVLFNPAFAVDDHQDAEVDALRHLQADFAPAIVFFGTDDNWKVGWEAVYSNLQKLGNRTVDLQLAEGQPHGFFNREPWRTVTLHAADRFLVEQGLLEGKSTLTLPDTGERLNSGQAKVKEPGQN